MRAYAAYRMAIRLIPIATRTIGCANERQLTAWAGIEPGVELSRKTQRIRDPIHDLIEFANNELDQTCWEALNSRAVQRLRRIKQLGFSDYVYPGASHSRLSHSVGVFHTARQLADVVYQRLGGSRGSYDSGKAQVAVCAALLHDIGHGPFSHAFEHALDGVGLSRKHVSHTEMLVRGTELAEIFEKNFGSDFLDPVVRTISNQYPDDIYASIVSSQFDADRLDYMRRDKYFSGTQQSGIDFIWLTNNLEVRKVTIGDDDQRIKQLNTFVLNPKARIAAEEYAFSLFYLYINVYFHKTTRAFEMIFTALLERVARAVLSGDVAVTGIGENHPIVEYLRNPDDVEAFLRLDDSVMYGALSQFAGSANKAISELATRVRDRRAYGCVDVSKIMQARFEQPDEPDRAARAAARLEAQIRTARAIELVKDRGLTSAEASTGVPAVLADEKAIRSAYKQEGKLSSIYLLGADEKIHDLASLSPAVDALEEYRAYRLYARDEEGKKLIDSVLEDVCQ
jgi:HD superfamily phosphohydrolase